MSLLHIHPQFVPTTRRSPLDKPDDTRLALFMVALLFLIILVAFGAIWLRVRALNQSPAPDLDDTAPGRLVVLVIPTAHLLSP